MKKNNILIMIDDMCKKTKHSPSKEFRQRIGEALATAGDNADKAAAGIKGAAAAAKAKETLQRGENKFVIETQLPSLNDYVMKCRSHWSKGAAMKEQVENTIALYIRSAKNKKQCWAVEDPCIIWITWFEKSKRRDVDNIQSGQKFILDAMQKTGLIPNDSRKYVKQINHTVVDAYEDKVEVVIELI